MKSILNKSRSPFKEINQPIPPIFILVGGLGTRLRGLVSGIPKPLAPIGTTPFLSYMLRNWVKQGARKFILLAGYQAELVKVYAKDFTLNNVIPDLDISVVAEDIPLGTGGAAASAIAELDFTGNFFLANGDAWFRSELKSLIESGPQSITVVRHKCSERFGSVEIRDGFVKKFEEKKISGGESLINAGLYFFSTDFFCRFASTEGCSLEREVFPHILSQGEVLKGVLIDSDFIDIGVPEDYLYFCEFAVKENTLDG